MRATIAILKTPQYQRTIFLKQNKSTTKQECSKHHMLPAYAGQNIKVRQADRLTQTDKPRNGETDTKTEKRTLYVSRTKIHCLWLTTVCVCCQM